MEENMSLNLSLGKMPHSNFKRKATEFEAGVGRCSSGQTFQCASVVVAGSLLASYFGVFPVYFGFYLGLPYTANIIENLLFWNKSKLLGVKIYYNP